jgi:3'-5' exoribonuclease 1
MKYIIFDLEATCWDQYDRSDNETIEIGAIMIDENRKIVKEFNQFVKPIKYPKLSEFCIKLTSIKQEEIDKALYFHDVKKMFLDWIGQEEYVLCSWGFYDKKQLESDCIIHSIDIDWVQSHISLKHQYSKFKNLDRAIGMKRALEYENIKMEGKHHRGIDDAKNISKIFIKYFDYWEFC